LTQQLICINFLESKREVAITGPTSSKAINYFLLLSMAVVIQLVVVVWICLDGGGRW